jgi:hypothetical protein
VTFVSDKDGCTGRFSVHLGFSLRRGTPVLCPTLMLKNDVRIIADSHMKNFAGYERA